MELSLLGTLRFCPRARDAYITIASRHRRRRRELVRSCPRFCCGGLCMRRIVYAHVDCSLGVSLGALFARGTCTVCTFLINNTELVVRS